MKKLMILFSVIFYSCSFSQENKNNEIKNIEQISLENISKHLKAITNTPKSRNYKNVKTLHKVAAYIKKEFEEVCVTTSYQPYNVQGNVYKNVIGSIGVENKKRIVIGAHYDVFGDSQGADDNASGIVGLLELARLLSKEKLFYRIDFVAYTLEEPPFFRTKKMGSYIHAKYIYDNEIDLKGMICLETIGYYSSNPNSQKFPIKGMNLVYGNIGDFITVVQNNKKGSFSNKVKGLMEQKKYMKTKSFKGSSLVAGVDFSDHLNYWKFNYDAVMITNTAFYRNSNYHTSKDTIETLDIKKMSLVIQQLYETIKELD